MTRQIIGEFECTSPEFEISKDVWFTVFQGDDDLMGVVHFSLPSTFNKTEKLLSMLPKWFKIKKKVAYDYKKCYIAFLISKAKQEIERIKDNPHFTIDKNIDKVIGKELVKSL